MNLQESDMIQFSEDSPFNLPQRGDGSGYAVIGIGRAGVHVVDQLVLENNGLRNIYAVDTDEETIRGTVAPHRHLLGKFRLRGLGTGGDVELAARLAHEEAEALEELFAGVRTAVIVAALGGGTGTGVTPVVARQLKDRGVRVIVVACSPFTFEGRRRLLGEASLRALEDAADIVVGLANERLLHLPEAQQDIREVFRGINSAAGRVCLALHQLLQEHGTAPMQMGELREYFGTAAMENAWAGFGSASGVDRIERVVAQILASPLLDDGTAWRQSEAALLTVTGGRDMAMAEYQTLVRRLQEEMPVELTVRGTAVVDGQAGDLLKATLVLTSAQSAEVAPELEIAKVAAPVASKKKSKTSPPAPVLSTPIPEPEPLHAAALDPEPDSFENHAFPELAGSGTESRPLGSKPSTPQRYFAQQEELQLDAKINRGRFEKTSPTVVDGQDLDVPTFMRLQLKVRI
jgi:cell division protein FtsZ